MALQLKFREITQEDVTILHMVSLRNGKAEDYLCCDVTNEDGVTETTWYSKADVALWGEDYIRAHTTMKYSDYRAMSRNGKKSVCPLSPSALPTVKNCWRFGITEICSRWKENPNPIS